MIDTIRYYSQHTVIGIITEGVPGLISALDALVHQVGLSIIFQIAISATVFYLHHNLFALGFVVGFIFDKEVREVVEKVNTVFDAHRTLLERTLLFGGGGLLALLTMPTSMVIVTFYYSAQWGALLYQSSAHRYRPASEESTDEANDLDTEQPFDQERDDIINITETQGVEGG